MEACVDAREQSIAEVQKLSREKTGIVNELASQKEIYVSLECDFHSISTKVGGRSLEKSSRLLMSGR